MSKSSPEYRRAYYRANRERILEQNKAWREANREQDDAAKAAWYDANRERIAAKHQTPEGKLKLATRNRAYRRENRELIRDANRRRRAVQMGANHEPFTTQDVVDRYGLNCFWCGVLTDRDAPAHNSGLPGWEVSMHVDHYVALVNGGDDTLDNVRTACAKCNLKRGKKSRVG